MREIKDFVEMIKKRANWLRDCAKQIPSTFCDASLCELETLMDYPEFQALKALVDKPFEVTEEVVRIALEKWFADEKYKPWGVEIDSLTFQEMKAALQAVFEHIVGEGKKINSKDNQLHLEKEIIREMIKPKKEKQEDCHHPKTTAFNFSDREKSETHYGVQCNICGHSWEMRKQLPNKICSGCGINLNYYVCECPSLKQEPKRQTFLEFLGEDFELLEGQIKYLARKQSEYLEQNSR